MVRFASVLLILATVYMTKCFIHFDGFHYYDKYHLTEILIIIQKAYSETFQQLKMMFQNDTLTKQELHETIKEWAKKQGSKLANIIVKNLNEIQQKINEMQKNIEESTEMNMHEKEALKMILKMKANMSMTNSQENKAVDQFMKSFNRTDRIKLHVLLRRIILQSKRNHLPIPRINEPSDDAESDELDKSDESDEKESDGILVECEPCNCFYSEEPFNFRKFDLNLTFDHKSMKNVGQCIKVNGYAVHDIMVHLMVQNFAGCLPASKYARIF
ncbi:hypothetical protein ACH3XW_28630 [Acanthocheilonema viteae]